MKNREIKFRVWIPGVKRFCCGGPFKLNDIRYDEENNESYVTDNHYNDPDFAKIKDEYVQQFTGLYDKNNKEIYEGDIAKIEYRSEYEIFNENGEFIRWSDNEVDFYSLYKIFYYIGEYSINCNEYTIASNGFVCQRYYDSKWLIGNKPKKDRQLGDIMVLGTCAKEENCGFFGMNSKNIQIIGNIFENPELLQNNDT